MNWLDPTDPILCESFSYLKHETGYVLEVIGSAYPGHMKFKSLLGCPNGTLQAASSWLKCMYPHASRLQPTNWKQLACWLMNHKIGYSSLNTATIKLWLIFLVAPKAAT